MGAVSAIALGLAAVSAAAAVKGGLEAKEASEEQAELATKQAGARAAETRRLKERQVKLEQREIEDIEKRQKLAFLASGVTLDGSPLLVMEETRRRGAENIEEIEKAGTAGELAQIAEGRATAKAARASGRQALISGIASGARQVSGLAG
jgi:hypothetical protein